ncbi:hypothetical protein TSUD_19850 [Trifolium subterraneum]|uniref:Uncharacterized protein n=1 Tax=Trifolium subterraneum TaxID=3900 RepID=A0A2Z6NJ45_TRISU|nr:hypothetical protein TSUD_19850 [Trifolium subterraneum]
MSERNRFEGQTLCNGVARKEEETVFTEFVATETLEKNEEKPNDKEKPVRKEPVVVIKPPPDANPFTARTTVQAAGYERIRRRRERGEKMVMEEKGEVQTTLGESPSTMKPLDAGHRALCRRP